MKQTRFTRFTRQDPRMDARVWWISDVSRWVERRATKQAFLWGLLIGLTLLAIVVILTMATAPAGAEVVATVTPTPTPNPLERYVSTSKAPCQAGVHGRGDPVLVEIEFHQAGDVLSLTEALGPGARITRSQHHLFVTWLPRYGEVIQVTGWIGRQIDWRTGYPEWLRLWRPATVLFVFDRVPGYPQGQRFTLEVTAPACGEAPPTETPSVTPTVTASPSSTRTETPAPTATATPSATSTPSPTTTLLPTVTPTRTETPVATGTLTLTPSATAPSPVPPSATVTPSETLAPTVTPTATGVTRTPRPPTPTWTPRPPTPTGTPPTPVTPTETPPPTQTPEVTATPEPPRICVDGVGISLIVINDEGAEDKPERLTHVAVQLRGPDGGPINFPVEYTDEAGERLWQDLECGVSGCSYSTLLLDGDNLPIDLVGFVPEEGGLLRSSEWFLRRTILREFDDSHRKVNEKDVRDEKRHPLRLVGIETQPCQTWQVEYHVLRPLPLLPVTGGSRPGD